MARSARSDISPVLIDKTSSNSNAVEEHSRAWLTPFEDPIVLPDGQQLLALKGAADYITKLPNEDSDLAQWQVAIEALMLCSRGGHAMLARIAFMKALNRNVVIPFNPDAKKHNWGKRKLKREE